MPRLNTGIHQTLAVPNLVDGLASLRMEPMSTSHAPLTTLLRDETEFWGRLVKLIGFTSEA